MCNCIRSNGKSVIEAYNTAQQTLATGVNIQFMNFNEYGSAIVPSGTIGVKIHKAGRYLVMFTGVAVENGTAGDITAQLYINGEAVADASGTEYSPDTTRLVNLAFTKVIDVKRSCGCVDNTTVLSVENVGVGAIYSNAKLTVIEI